MADRNPVELYHEDLEAMVQTCGIDRRMAFRRIIAIVEARMRAHPDATGPHPFPLEHEFADGIYKRTIHVPAGALVVGMIHRYAHFCVITKGTVSVLTEDGAFRREAPFMFLSPAGAKRLVFHHTDTDWTTFHATHETDVAKIEQQIISPNFEALECAGGVS
jgi:hypothetical protein